MSLLAEIQVVEILDFTSLCNEVVKFTGEDEQPICFLRGITHEGYLVYS